MQKKHKEYVFIIGLLVVLGALFFGIKYMGSQNAENIEKLQVRYKDSVLEEIDLSVDGIYEIEVVLGHLSVEVENGQYRVVDVDCPDKICESVGWVKKGSETLIVCLPNNIVLVQG